MVRFIITVGTKAQLVFRKFTFHYGQIYYAIVFLRVSSSKAFTFHYGQIYYSRKNFWKCRSDKIYIPLWLDLLFFRFFRHNFIYFYLHSTMVRFIIKIISSLFILSVLFTFHYGQIYYSYHISFSAFISEIYIPLWLDLLFVRLFLIKPNRELFTFHYGQIYYTNLSEKFLLVKRIYIPLWLDLLFSA